MLKYLFIISILFVQACGLFETREPEEPKGQGSGYIPAATPEILIENMKKSFNERNTANYISLFADSSVSGIVFRFLPSAGASVKYPWLSDWKLYDEEQYFNKIKNLDNYNSGKGLTLSFKEKNLAVDSALYLYDYSILLKNENQSLSEYKGIARFTMKTDGTGNWIISEWTDIQTGSDLSWSDLKGIYH